MFVQTGNTAAQRMLDEIEREVRFTAGLIGKNRLDPRVMAAMQYVPRDRFVPDDQKALAFYNGPLPIGHGQTISQPFIVALMSDLVRPQKAHNLLEIGTGSGYQAAVLSRLCNHVYTIERITALQREAESVFQELGYHNITCATGNGYQGWPEFAPFDGIIVTAAASHIPDALVQQLKPGGRLVIPVGLPYMSQELMVVEKHQDGSTRVEDVLGVVFVPLVDQDTVTGDSELH